MNYDATIIMILGHNQSLSMAPHLIKADGQSLMLLGNSSFWKSLRKFTFFVPVLKGIP